MWSLHSSHVPWASILGAVCTVHVMCSHWLWLWYAIRKPKINSKCVITHSFKGRAVLAMLTLILTRCCPWQLTIQCPLILTRCCLWRLTVQYNSFMESMSCSFLQQISHFRLQACKWRQLLLTSNILAIGKALVNTCALLYVPTQNRLKCCSFVRHLWAGWSVPLGNSIWLKTSAAAHNDVITP